MGKISQDKDKEKKKQILSFLKKNSVDWHTGSKIASETGIHFYKAEYMLHELLSQDKVELDDTKGVIKWWRIKQE